LVIIGWILPRLGLNCCMSELKYKTLTSDVIGAAMAVHNELGSGFPEVYYQRALAIELEIRGIQYLKERAVNVFYKDRLIGNRRVDFLIEEQIMVEVKAVNQLDIPSIAKGRNYLEAYHLEVGLLINFGSMSLEFKRLQNSKYIDK
jgi:GxxExxY protein